MSTKVQGMLATTSEDHTVSIWDTLNITDHKPALVTSKNPACGKLFCGNFSEDSAWVFGCGNSKGEIFIWDTTEDKRIVDTFSARVDGTIKPDPN